MDVVSAQILNQVLSNCFVLESHESKSPRLSVVDVFEDDSTFNGSILREMLLKVHIGELEVQSSDKDLGLWIFVDYFFWLVIVRLSGSYGIAILLFFNDYPWIGLVHMHQWILWLLQLVHGNLLLEILLMKRALLVHDWLEALHLVVIEILPVVEILLTALISRASHLWLYIVVCRFHINSLVIDVVARVSI